MKKTLGETRVAVRIFGPKAHADVTLLVDTGATFTKISQSLAKELDIVPDETVTVLLSDGSKRTCGLAEAKMELDGAKRTVPIAIGPDNEEPILGFTALEILRFKVDPVARRLERTIPLEF